MSTFTQFSPNAIKSIQRGTVTITNGNTSGSAGISSVNTNKSLITYLGATASSTIANDALGRVELSNSTTVSAYRTGSNNLAFYAYQVVEYY